MNKKNYISILITNYNKGFFLQRSLKSACNQNFKNYEIILFDDSSTDNSIEIIKKYKKVKLIKNQSTRRKTGPLNQIKGLIANSDDSVKNTYSIDNSGAPDRNIGHIFIGLEYLIDRFKKLRYDKGPKVKGFSRSLNQVVITFD